METLILKTPLLLLFKPAVIEFLCREGYQNTGCKFSINFNGSKGYLDNVEIECEGNQKEGENRIYRDALFNKNMSIKKKDVSIFYSEENGIRIGFGKDKPRLIKVKTPVINEDSTKNTKEVIDEDCYYDGLNNSKSGVFNIKVSIVIDEDCYYDGLPF